MKKRKLLQMLSVVLPFAAALLSTLPNVVKMNWMGGVTTYCSAYSLLPVGYAVWGPFLAAVGAVVLVVLCVVYIFLKRDGLRKAMFVIAAVSALFGLSVAIFGNLTFPGALISLLLALEAALMQAMGR